MNRAKKKQETLSDKISGILSAAPTSFDPEDDIYEETTAKLNDIENEESENEEVALSKFRKANVELLDEVDKRYVGKKGTRKSLKDSDEEWSTEDEGLSTDEGEALDGIEGTQEKASDDESESQDDDDEEEGDVEDESESDFSDGDMVAKEDQEAPEEEDNFKHISDTNVTSQNKKGICVRNQLNIWENLLEMRIQMQKCLIQSNKMPQYDVYKNFESDPTFKTEINKTKRNMTNVLSKLLDLQLLLLKKYPETKTLLKNKNNPKKEESDEEIPSDTDEEIKEESSDDEEEEEEKVPKKRLKLSEYEQEISTRQNKYREYRNSVIQKWNDKTRLTLAKNNTGSNSIIQHINFLLEDKQKLVKRTQLKRSEYEIVGKIKPELKTNANVDADIVDEQNTTSKQPDEYDTEIYDDDDFYHQLLRELIEFKSAGITDPIQMSKQWIQLQNLRSKMKRKIDTKATKGRKIRYAIHSKLVNFMAPIDYSTMTEEAKNELYSSLFGRKL